jgi:hypothetical protein
MMSITDIILIQKIELRNSIGLWMGGDIKLLFIAIKINFC